MNHTTLSLASYWRNSLADAELGKGAWYDIDANSHNVRPRIELNQGQLDKSITDTLFDPEPDDVSTIEVALYPFIYKLKVEHGSKKQHALPLIITPVVIKALLDRSGKLIPSGKIFVPRDLLEPLDRNTFSIGTVDNLDVFLTNHPVPKPHESTINPGAARDDRTDRSDMEDWKYMLAYCESMYDQVCRKEAIHTNGYLRAREWMVRKLGSHDAPSRRITSLYDHFRQSYPKSPLFERLCSTHEQGTDTLISPEANMALHAGHCSNRYPLAKAQRDALTHALNMAEGDILAINGPPGTGKTTLVISMVASLWVQAALAGEQPPIVMASSTNNQAVTNILDAFARDIDAGTGPYAGRWIEKVNQFGMYLSSRSRQLDVGDKYIGADFFREMESIDGIAMARDQFMEKARVAFPDLRAPSVSKVVQRLHEELVTKHEILSEVKKAYDNWIRLNTMVQKVLGENHSEALMRFDRAAALSKKRHNNIKRAYLELISHLSSQPIWYDLLRFIPSISKREGVRASIVVKRTLKNIDPHMIWKNVDVLKHALKIKMDSIKVQADKAQVRKRKAHSMIEHLNRAHTQLSLSFKMIASRPGANEPATLEQANTLSDTYVRHELFQIATHYWEGRWLMEVDGKESLLVNQAYQSHPQVVHERWLRRMMLTPCAVSTLFMLPGEMRVLEDNDRNKPTYLYNAIDWLLIDEAGQTLPEIAAASFTLAKRAIAIGDTHQIEPIWSVPKSVDIGNLVQYRVCQGEEEAIDAIRMQGKLASGGNLMAMAQFASRYHYDPDMPKGMFLYEHRRCYNEIIAYCNALSYKNKLIPARGQRSADTRYGNALPAMGYLDVEGVCRLKASGTRYNEEEAKAIVAWIISKQLELEGQYNMPIEKIIGIVTPFTGQVETLRHHCRQAGLDISMASGITIGTVHSLQGAERPIIIFSPTYCKKNNGPFIDSSPSMLNVAVSRAKDSFLFMGDMSLMDSRLSFTPRGLLASFLKRHEANRLCSPDG